MEEEILNLMAEWRQAIDERNLDLLTSHYDEKSHLFDCKLPHQAIGKEAIRKVWDDCFPFLPVGTKSEHRDIVVHVNGSLAFVYGIHRFNASPEILVGFPPGFEFPWLRITVCYEKLAESGIWMVRHEHVSLPFNPMTHQVENITP